MKKINSEPATKRQLDCIKTMQRFGNCPPFAGKTTQDACDYIIKYRDQFELESVENWLACRR